MHIECRKPFASVFEGEADKILAPCKEGKLGILNNHAPMFCILTPGELVMGDKNFPIKGGFLEVKENRVVIFLSE